MRHALYAEDGCDEQTARDEAVQILQTGTIGELPVACLLAHHGHRPVGFIEVSRRNAAEFCDGGPVVYVEGWFVRPEHRGRGIGRALIRAAEQWGRERGCGQIASDTQEHNQASRRAHAACGFEDMGLLRHFVRPL